MKKQLLIIPFLIFLVFQQLGYAQVKLLPFVGKDKSEVVLAYNSATGKSVEWYFDNQSQKMMHAKSGFQLPSKTEIAGAVEMACYIDPRGSEVVLVWSPVTGQSVSWYYDNANQKMMKSAQEFQLPAAIGLAGKIMMHPYIGADKSEVILCWETATGKSVEYYYDNSLKKFRKADVKFQLPENPGVSGNVMMHPYIGNDGSEITLIWNKSTGQSVAWYLNEAQGKYIKAEPDYQLPANPEISGNVMMYPYVGKDGSEIILTWSMNSGQSVSYYFENSTKKFTKSSPMFQLPSNPGVGSGVLICPFVEKNNNEVIYVWSSATGLSFNYYFDETLKKFTKSDAKWQLPENPLQ